MFKNRTRTTDKTASGWRRTFRGLAAFLTLALALAPGQVFAIGDVLEEHRALPDYDLRDGALRPSAAASALVDGLGATVRWNRFGTPRVLFSHGDVLSSGYTGAPATAARDWVRDHGALFNLSPASVDALTVARESALTGSDATVVEFRQTAGGLPIAGDGSIKVGIVDGQIFWVSSTAVGDVGTVAAAAVSATDAWLAAAQDVGLAVGAPSLAGSDHSWTLLDAGLSHPQRVRPVALAIPGEGVIPAYESIVLDTTDGRALAYTAFVDGRDGQVLVRQNKVWRAVAEWSFFTANPLFDHSTVDTRTLACWTLTDENGDPVPGCEMELDNLAARGPWDHDFTTGAPTFNTTGNAAATAEAWFSPLTPDPVPYRPVAADRHYVFPWTNEWFNSGCDPTVINHTGGLLADNDIDAAIANLFAMHNRMHDWSYYLGFTEVNGNAQVNNFGQTTAARQNDPEIGNAQAGARDGGYPAYLGRDNANQITLNDGIPPITNMYLWQSVAGVIYVPCVDGDYDAAVIAHEYGHMIQNRMVDPENGLTGDHGRAMGESWSDLTAIEHLNAQGFVPIADENPFALGAYITGKKETGIRNYGMNVSPLNFSNMDYDPAGQFASSPHSNGEIWSAVNYDIRQALMAKYDATHPSSDMLLQQRCADGEIPADLCPGNRRWAQIFHDAFLLIPREPTMVDARDGYLAADLARSLSPSIVWPANQDELWDAFARRGLGTGATAGGSGDVDPTPSFETASGANATVTFDLVGADEGDFPVTGEVFVGQFESYARPVADTLAATALSDTAQIAAGDYEFVARAEGYGHFRFTASFAAGEVTTVTVRMPSNWASLARGASASGDGVDFEGLIDETEETNWERSVATGDIVGSAVTVELAGGPREVSRVQVSAMPEVGENRFTTLRQFAVETCDATASDCSNAANYSRIYTSPADAFPASGFRPIVPDWLLRSFDVPSTVATHVRLVVLNNHCTGNPEYQDPIAADNDPVNPTDCRVDDPVLSRRDRDVRVAELQVFSTTVACEALPPSLVVSELADGLQPLTGDGDVFVDNCEDHNLSFAVANHGGENLTGIEVVDIRSTSHPAITVNTPLPFALAPIASGCNGPTGLGSGTFNFTGAGLAHGDTIVFEVEVMADQIVGTQVGTLTIAQAESDFETADVSFSFEADAEGWELVSGTFDHTVGPGAPAPVGAPVPSAAFMASSAAVDDACDQIRSPVLRLSSTSTLSLWNQFAIEPGEENSLGFYDRANVGLFDPASESRSLIIPDGGLRPYNVPDGSPNGACNSGQGGWSGAGPGWLDAQWSSAALGTGSIGPNGREVQIDVRNATDPLAAGAGFWFDSVLVTDVLVAAPDQQSDVCDTTNSRPVAGDDSASTPQDTAVTIDVLANDSDPDGDPIAVGQVQSPTAQGGSASSNGDGTVTYTPPAGFNGTDTFTYQACDDGGLCDTATVTVTVGSGGGGGGGGGGCNGDDDDFDSDGKRDDIDSDDDDDGSSDNSDSDDDNDGDSDNSDSDDDNDCIADEFDSESAQENQSQSSDQAAPGQANDSSLPADPGALLLVALVEGPGAETLTVEIYDPAGALVATSVPAPGRALATAVPLAAGDYTVRVRNDGAAAVAYDLTLIERVAWP